MNVPLLVYCVKLLTYCLPTLSGAAARPGAYARLLPPLGAFIRVAYLNHGLLLLSLYCALLYSTKATWRRRAVRRTC